MRLIFFIFLCSTFCGVSLAVDCSSIPFNFWCSNDEIISTCNFTDLCKRYSNATFNKPVKLTVLIESLCPDTENWLINHLYPQVYKNVGNFVNIDFVPYGNAKIVKNEIVCQHGEDECRINRYEGCAISTLKSQNLYVPFIYCLENMLKNKSPFDKANEKCIATLGIGHDLQKIIQTCDSSNEGIKLQHLAANTTASIWPDKHTNIPWVLFNDISLSKAQRFIYSIPSLVCDWYKGDKAIPYCASMRKNLTMKSSRRMD